jgi:hypothetical protein
MHRPGAHLQFAGERFRVPAAGAGEAGLVISSDEGSAFLSETGNTWFG